MDETKNLMTVAEAAGRLRVCQSFFYLLLKRGEIGSVKVGKCRRIPPCELDRYIGEKFGTARAGEGKA